MVEEFKIENMIYEIRGKQVMLDRDLARLYQCANGTKDINKAVRRNIDKFPNDFYFQLSREEYYQILRFQNGTLELELGKYSKYNPYVFTEQGVAMLASVLKTKIASKISVNIMRAFVEMRKYISTNLIEQKYINDLVIKHDFEIKVLQESFDKLNNDLECDGLFFENQIYDSYSILLEIFNKSKREIIIIDNYIDKKILDVLRKIDKDIIIYTNKYNNEDYDKYSSQYKNIKMNINNSFHDRFIILDRNILYHSGASFKDLGKRCFCITLIKEKEWLFNILKKLNLVL